MNVPDKSTYKTTVTSRLRDDIKALIDDNNLKSYLEIGCDCGYTMMCVAESTVESLTGIDIDPNRAAACRKNLAQSHQKTNVIAGTSANIPIEQFDIILIDANHTYEGVKNDFENVTSRNTARTYFIVFHDYGLAAMGVKKFVDETFRDYKKIGLEKNWNPLGGAVNDYEAALVEIRSQK